VQAFNFYGVLAIKKEQIIGAVYCLLTAVIIWTVFGLAIIRIGIKKVN